MALNDKQRRFVAEYRKDLNATKAYIRAGYSKNGAGQAAKKLLMNAEIKAELSDMTADQLDKAELSAVRTLEEMRRLGFSNVKRLFDAEGNLKPIHLLSDEDAACISGLEVVMKNATAGDGKVDRVLKVKIWDKRATLEMLGKHFALLDDRVKLEASDELIQALFAGRARAAKVKK